MASTTPEIRRTVRRLARHRGYAAIAISVLALGIGANSALFSVVDAVLLRPLPYEDPDELVRIYEENPQKDFQFIRVSLRNFADWRDWAETFEGMAAWTEGSATITGGDRPERVETMHVSPSTFSVLGVYPAVGTAFSPEDERGGGEARCIISDRVRSERFGGGDPTGRTLYLDGVAHQVLGAMPPDFEFPEPDVDVWLPLLMDEANLPVRGGHTAHAVGRLRDGRTLEDARTEMATFSRQLEREYPESNTGYGATLLPLHEAMVKDVRRTILVLFGAVLFILLIACSNLANLTLVRAIESDQEAALRASLGAGRGHLIAVFLAESVVIAVAGALVGLALAYGGIRALPHLVPAVVPMLDQASIDGRVLAFTLVLALGTPLVFGLWPALRASRPKLGAVLKEGGSRGASRGGVERRLGTLLATLQVALVLMLLVGAGLMMRTFLNLKSTDPGFRIDDVLTLQIALPERRYAGEREPARLARALLEEIESLPGVERAALTNITPLRDRFYRFEIEGRPSPPAGQEPNAVYGVVTPGYFEALGIPILEGRRLEERDRFERPYVLVISESMAERHFPGESPIGRRINFSFRSEPVWQEVVGVFGDIRHKGLAEGPYPGIYGSLYQWEIREMHLFVHSTAEPAVLMAGIRDRLRRLDAEIPIYAVQTLREQVGDTFAGTRFSMTLLSGLGFLALVLALLGIYGVIAYTVARESRDIGIRMALGATGSTVMLGVLLKAARIAAIGLAAGALGALAVTGVVSSLLVGVSALDPLTYVAVAVLIALAVLLAAAVPAWRASRVDPKVAMSEP